MSSDTSFDKYFILTSWLGIQVFHSRAEQRGFKDPLLNILSHQDAVAAVTSPSLLQGRGQAVVHKG